MKEEKAKLFLISGEFISRLETHYCVYHIGNVIFA